MIPSSLLGNEIQDTAFCLFCFCSLCSFPVLARKLVWSPEGSLFASSTCSCLWVGLVIASENVLFHFFSFSFFLFFPLAFRFLQFPFLFSRYFSLLFTTFFPVLAIRYSKETKPLFFSLFHNKNRRETMVSLSIR